jgi:hypothetical protein
MKKRSPFLVLEQFISPLTCETIVDIVDFDTPNMDEKGLPVPSTLSSETLHTLLADDLLDCSEYIEEYFDVKIRGIHPIEVEIFPEGCPATNPVCENSAFIANEWRRMNNKDFVAILFLNDFREKVPFDPDYEVMGGKLQFPTHGFGFNPKRGTLVVFPGNENFIRSTSTIQVGQLHQVVFRFTCDRDYVYNKSQFPGNYEVWFK